MSTNYFDEVASQWDSMRKSFFSDALREKALSKADVKRGKVAADIGAGSGFITEGLIRRGLRVIAIDQSARMLEEMRRKFGAGAGVEYKQGGVEEIPLPDAAVDYAFANTCLHHVETPLQAIGEMYRILKPEGRLVITDLDEHTFEFLKREQFDRWMGFKRDDILRWLNAAGFRNPSVMCAGENCSAYSSCGEGNATVSIFLAYGEK